MARIRGDDGVVLVDSNAVAAVREFTYEESGDEIAAPAMGDSAQVTFPSLPKVNVSLRVWYDPDDSTGQDVLIQGAEVDLELRPEGTGSGLPEFTLTDARVISETIRTAQGSAVEKELTLTCDTIASRTAQV